MMKTRLIPILTKTATTLFMLLFMMTAQTAWAQDPATSGTCGDYGNEDNVTWEVTGDAPAYTLTISGTGAMKNYTSNNPAPWAVFKSDITTAVIGDGVTRIGGNAFNQFTALTSVTIASSVTTIGNAVFFECTNLTTVSGASGVTYVDSSAFDETAWENNLPDGLTSVGHVAYRFVGDGTSVNLDAATTQIYEYCFRDSKITSIVIPASVECIGGYAFAHSALQKMYVLRSGSNSTEITQLGNDAFEECRDDLVIVVPTAAYSTYSGHWYSYISKLQRGYNITCNEGITATSYAPIVAQGETVTLSGTGTIPDGYAFAGYSVTKDGTNPAETVTVTEASGVYSFTMPASNVTVSAVPAIILSETQAAMPTLAEGTKVVFRREFKENVASTVCLPFAIDATQAAAAGKFYTFVGVDKTTDPANWEVIMQEADPNANPPIAGNEASALTANTPYLFKPAATGPVLFHGTAPASVSAGTTPTTGNTDGWVFQGTYARIDWTDDPQTVYGFAATNATTVSPGTFFRVSGGSNSYILPFRAYLDGANGGSSATRRASASKMPSQMKVRLIAADGTVTAIGTIDAHTGEVRFDSDAWFSIDGRRLSGKPSAAGVYINKGKKVVVR